MRLNAFFDQALKAELSHTAGVAIWQDAKDLLPMFLLQVIVTKGGNEISVLHDKVDFFESRLQNFVLGIERELSLDLFKAGVVLGDLLNNLLGVLVLENIVVPHLSRLVEVLTNLPDVVADLELV